MTETPRLGVSCGGHTRDDETLRHAPAQPHIHRHNPRQENLRTHRHHQSPRIRHPQPDRLPTQHQAQGTAKQQLQMIMKKQVVLSSYCYIISALSTALMCGIFIYALKQPDNEWAVWSLGGAIVILFLFTLCFMPLSISLDNESLNINRPLKIKSIPLAEITDVRLCSPTMGAKRICGSGGWFGWYGWFKENDLGKYFAYYGKASDCFLVTLKDGRRYMLGCKDVPEMVKAIYALIT